MKQTGYSILDERNQWKRDFEKGFSHLWLDEYRKNRDNPSWRSSRMMEQLCEYILYLEEIVNESKRVG